MERTRVWVTCVVVAVATGCTAISGADDFVVDRRPGDTSAATPRPDESTPPATSSKTEKREDESSPPPPPPTGGGSLPTLDGVACGVDVCGGSKPKCCAHKNGASECIAADGACDDGIVFACSDQESCVKGTVCCFITNDGKPHGECRAANNCAMPSVILCDHDDECPSKRCAGEIAGLDYEVCSPY